MARLIKKFNDGSQIEYDRGGFDDWCVFIRETGIGRYAPTDIQYFSELKDIGAVFGKAKIYNDFLRVYRKTDRKIDPEILKEISQMSEQYGKLRKRVDLWFSVIYAGMVAEENKERSILGKRIKRLGMYQLLIEEYEPAVAARFSRGRPWRELDAHMKKRGI